jgi:hypothetical protein
LIKALLYDDANKGKSKKAKGKSEEGKRPRSPKPMKEKEEFCPKGLESLANGREALG